MIVVKCDKGHFYNSELFSSCPQCSAEGQSLERFSTQQEVKHTSSEIRRAVEVEREEKIERGIPKKEMNSFRSSRDDMTIGMFGGENKADPVVGWLVCLKGEDVGKSFTLKAGVNSIGRAYENDVELSDQKISRENFSSIVFDPVKGEFILMPGKSSSLIYLQNEVLLTPTVVEERNLIKMGDSLLTLISFCNKNFTWVEEKR